MATTSRLATSNSFNFGYPEGLNTTVKRYAYLKHRVLSGIRDEGGAIPALRKAWLIHRRSGISTLLWGGWSNHGAGGAPDYKGWTSQHDTLSEVDKEAIRDSLATGNCPKISILLPTYETDVKFFNRAVDSVKRQLYPNWELCIADDASKSSGLKRALERASSHPKIKVLMRDVNGHISACSNSALSMATGEWVTFLDHDDELSQDALYQIYSLFSKDPALRMIYSDEDKLDRKGHRARAYFKPQFNREFLRGNNYITHMVAYRLTEVNEIGGFREGFEGAQDYDLVLRYSERLGVEEIGHIPMVLYHWREHETSTSLGMGIKNYALHAGEKALQEHLERKNIGGRVRSSPRGYYKVFYDLPSPAPSVSILIPSKDNYKLLAGCVNSIIRKTDYENFSIKILDNGSTCDSTQAFLEMIRQHPLVEVIEDQRPFNFARINNYGVSQCTSDFVLLLNDDTQVITHSWLREMVSTAAQQDVGVVGAKLLYGDNSVQHSGIIIGIGGSAGHAFKHHSKDDLGYWFRAAVRTEFSALTGACMLVRKSIYNLVAGMDEEMFPIAFNDVDFCLRVREAGFRNVFCPDAQLYHFESKTRGYEDTPYKQSRFAAERARFRQKWQAYIQDDPCYSPQLTRRFENFFEELDFSVRTSENRRQPLSPDDFDVLPSIDIRITPSMVAGLKGVFNVHSPHYGWIVFVGEDWLDAAQALQQLRPEAEIIVVTFERDSWETELATASPLIQLRRYSPDLLQHEPVDIVVGNKSLTLSEDSKKEASDLYARLQRKGAILV